MYSYLAEQTVFDEKTVKGRKKKYAEFYF